MDTYIPPTSAGILGGKSADGELDGIQAWKKGMKEKEQKEKDLAKSRETTEAESSKSNGHSASQDPQMDEIQFFKMLMKREQEHKHVAQVSPTIDELKAPPSAPTALQGRDFCQL